MKEVEYVEENWKQREMKRIKCDDDKEIYERKHNEIECALLVKLNIFRSTFDNNVSLDVGPKYAKLLRNSM